MIQINEFIQTDRKRVGVIVTSEETITEFPDFWGTCFYSSVFPRVYDGQKEERGNESF